MALQFPLDTKEINYEAKVSFTPIKLQHTDVEGFFSSLGNEFTIDNFDRGASATTGYSGEPQTLTRKRESVDAVNGETEGTETIVGTGQRGVRQSTITLFLPQAIQITDRADYENINLGVLGASTAAGLQAGQALIPTVVNNAAATVNSLIDTIVGGGALGTQAGRLATVRAAGLIPNEKVRGAVKSGSRVAVNPNTRTLFKEVPLREFTFTFKLIPTSLKETNAIKNIVKEFRTELYPEVIDIADIPAGYEFPNVFDIKMFYKNESNGLATKLLPSYLRSFTATYNSSSQAFFEGGDFTEVDISMVFVESSTMHKDRVKEGF